MKALAASELDSIMEFGFKWRRKLFLLKAEVENDVPSPG